MNRSKRGGGANSERREDVRHSVPAAYTAVQVRRAGRQRFSVRGHVLDVSAGGMCFEIDRPLTAGETIEVRVALPDGPKLRTLAATGNVLRHANAGEAGPARMAMAFWPRSKPRLRHELATAIG